MRRDFTINRYILLLEALMKQGFIFSTVYDYNSHRFRRLNGFHREEDGIGDERIIILRQDVDRLPSNSLPFARIQKEMGIRSTFYFRSVPQSFNPGIVEEIVGMGHEVGYHYEDVSLTANSSKFQVSSFKFREKDLIEESIVKFSANLEKLRKYADVRTICMHGSPLSRWDSRMLWKYYDYREFGIELEPYFDLNFEDMLYLTDTGRRWDGSRFSIRDKAEGAHLRSSSSGGQGGLRAEGRKKVAQSAGLRAQGNPSMRTSSLLRNLGSGHAINFTERGKRDVEHFGAWKVKPVPGSLMNMTDKSMEFQEKYNFRTTNDIIRAAERGELPESIMMNFHPHRWNEPGVQWWKELVGQNIKNGVKYFIIKIRQGN